MNIMKNLIGIIAAIGAVFVSCVGFIVFVMGILYTSRSIIAWLGWL